MELKVVCECGQKFKFDVEPVNGQMPFNVNCPVCNKDGTAAANAMLAELPKSPPPPVTATTVPPTSTVPRTALRIHIAESETTATPSPTPRPTAPRPIAALKSVSASTRKLAWYEHLWCALPLCLVAMGGAIGGGCGGLAWACNRQIFRKMNNPALCYCVTGVISVAAFGLYLVVAILFVMLFHKPS